MANTCAICGASINLIQQQKLADGNFICRKTCQKKGMKEYFDYVHASLPLVLDHNKQVEEGTKIFNDLFVPRIKGKKKDRPAQFGTGIFVLEDLGLIALAIPDYKFWIFGKYYPKACVYRLGDLMDYRPEKLMTKPDGTAVKAGQKYIHFIFNNTPGLSDFFYPYSGDAKKLADYFNKIYGIQKTLGNIGNTWKNQINAAKAVASGVKAAVKGEEGAEEKAADAVNALDVAIYGDRTELNRRAAIALQPYLKGEVPPAAAEPAAPAEQETETVG